jgi:hypothetical protein
MKKEIFLVFRLFLFCFFVSMVQVSLVQEFTQLNVNLLFSSLIVFAGIRNTKEVILANLFFIILSTMLLYDASIPWIYALVSITASRLNPEQIPDKFLLCMIYTIFLTPIIEAFNPMTSSYIEKISEGILVNLISMLPLFFLIKFFFHKKIEKVNLPL